MTSSTPTRWRCLRLYSWQGAPQERVLEERVTDPQLNGSMWRHTTLEIPDVFVTLKSAAEDVKQNCQSMGRYVNKMADWFVGECLGVFC